MWDVTSAPDWLTLDPEETVVRTAQPRVRRVLSTGAGALLFAATGVAVGVVATRSPDLALPAGPVWGGVALVVLLTALSVGWRYLVTVTTEYVLTTQNVYERTGVLSETVTRVGLDNVQRIELERSFLGRVFDHGTLSVSTAGSGGEEVTLADLDDPDAFRDDLRRLSTRAGERARERGRDRSGAGIDADTLDVMAEEAGRLRASAERIREEFT